jgi:hypothetical protein
MVASKDDTDKILALADSKDVARHSSNSMAGARAQRLKPYWYWKRYGKADGSRPLTTRAVPYKDLAAGAQAVKPARPDMVVNRKMCEGLGQPPLGRCRPSGAVNDCIAFPPFSRWATL